MALLQSYNTAPVDVTRHYPIVKVEHFADLPEFIQNEWRHLPHYRAGANEPDADVETWVDGSRWSLLTTEGCERETFRLTGIAVIDGDRYVARVQVNGGRTAFYPVVKGTHHCSPYRSDAGHLGTKADAFQFFIDNQPTPATDGTDVHLAAESGRWRRDVETGLDARDTELLAERVTEHDRQFGPRVGDFVRYPDGRLNRFTHDHDERGLQVGSMADAGTGECGSFHLTRHGADYSGGLQPCLRRDTLHETGETMLGRVWFFHHNRPEANNGVDVRIPFRVFTCSVPAAGVGA